VILLDVNVLVYAHRQDSERHEEYRDWLLSVLDGPEPCGLSELVLAGCLRILTHPKVFSPPTPLNVARDYVRQLHDHPNVNVVEPGSRHWGLFLALIDKTSSRGNLISDAYHAALAMESGCEWITTDRDYARFPGLRWRHPLQTS
jgi:uncharacterized protein